MRWWQVVLVVEALLASVVSGVHLTPPKHDAVKATEGLIERRLGKQYLDQIALDVIPATADGRDVLEVDSKGNKVSIKGSSATALGYALHWYLKHVVHTQTDWKDHQLHLPDVLPTIDSPVRVERSAKYSYYENVCTVSYSQWTWGWARWERHIDWMALNGINMPLAFTGQEKVWQATFKKFNVSDAGLNKFFAGAAFLAWGRMGNLRGSWVKGPLPQKFIDDQFDLQVKILARMREYGMIPALPGFAGHIPQEIATIYKNATISRSPNWGNFPDDFCCVYMLDPTDPLYTAIGKTFIEEQTRLYGFTSSLYQADTYNEMDPAQSDPTYLAKASKAVIDSMTLADPNAVWLMQGWLFLSGYWTNERIQAYVGGVPDDKMIILDLYSEVVPIWKKSHNYFGKPWIYCVLHNFGGNMGLRGDLPTLASDPVVAKAESNGTMIGIGLTMEGIFQNYIVYDLTLQMAWTSQPVDLDVWVPDFIHSRYHVNDENAKKTWTTLLHSVYNVTKAYGGVTKSLVTLRPHWKMIRDSFMPTIIAYEAKHVVHAWQSLLDAVKTTPELATVDTYRHDVVDVTRQALSDLLCKHYEQLEKDFADGHKPASQIEARAHVMKDIIADMDRILASHEDFLLGKWLRDAKALAGDDADLSLYLEYEARNQVTRWGDSNGNVLGDYATKQWSGLISSYYAPRWQIWLQEVVAAYKEHRPVDEAAVRAKTEKFELAWNLETKSYPIEPRGDPIALSQHLYTKYIQVVVFDSESFLPLD
ncbi:unnamed protein product [Aphanomyces euteiches]|uniref:Alpha-N-acetylglucosaminidase n=1 Tax=Aphanomyces euteiches TaxID=100861 RepID=A0A6G0XFE1_9STRA|nr:hypothetical protein Ae201684_005307 [Aphanomyces euteiches]KAH9053540.1 hypothetical protein Ae201684P_015305 [Aphanomyces euteiches]KAH9132758.1 hypothetical protein AeRB84_020962 [Aphanomyces euteiches]